MENDIVAVGKIVSTRYVLRNERGELIEENFSAEKPFSYLHGAKNTIPGFQWLLDGRRVGDVLHSVRVPPEAAYGLERQALMVPRDEFEELPALAVGDSVQISSENGEVELSVVAIEDRAIFFGGERVGHRLAGEALIYDRIEITDVRDPEPSELAANQVSFPFDIFNQIKLPGPDGELLAALRHLCMFPPYPWGQRLYAEVFRTQCRELDGDVIELGVGKGGMSIFLATLCRTLGKRVFSLDSFQGLPPPDPVRDNPYFQNSDYAGRPGSNDLFDRFCANTERFGVKDIITPVRGYFQDTLPRLEPGQRFCFAHLDSDLYDSVLLSLDAIYDRVVDGGVIVIDDFFHHAMGPARAATDFFNRRQIYPTYHVSFPYSVFIIKGESDERPNETPRSLDGNWYSFDWLRRDQYFVDIVNASVERNRQVAGASENSRILADLLNRNTYRSSDIYLYWKALEDYWDSFSTSRREQPPLRI